MADRLADWEHDNRFSELSGNALDVGSVGGRPFIPVGTLIRTDQFDETTGGSSQLDSSGDSGDFFDFNGTGKTSQFYAVALTDLVASRAIMGGFIGTTSAYMSVFSGNRVIFEQRGTGGRQIIWDLDNSAEGFTVDTILYFGMSVDIFAPAMRASKMLLSNGGIVTPFVSPTGNMMAAAQGWALGDNNLHMAQARRSYRFGSIIGEALTTVDLDDTTAAMKAQEEIFMFGNPGAARRRGMFALGGRPRI